MPSSSSKQHNFMEAVAHSPSFAKKAGVPQSVGKDFSAADKGRKFSKGGDMAESKKMVGKEVAFMKKKGAPAAMIKHEKAEMMGMKKGGKVRRYGAGGGPLGDESIMTDEEYARQREQGAKNWKSLKNFFGFGEKVEPAEEPKSRSVAPTRTPVSAAPAQTTPAETTRVTTPKISTPAAASMSDQMEAREKGGSNYGTDSNYSDYDGDLGSSSQTFKRQRKPIGVEKTQTKERVITAPVKPSAKDVSKFSSDSPDLESRMEAMKPKRKFGMASDETRAAIRKGLGSAFDFFDLSKAHEREFGKKMAKGGDVDGIAKKGKTEGKVVKMAAGGFVKTADGCAQRGKTKAFQVKMKRGGMC